MNSDLIKIVESNPDTVITLISGDKVLVHESAEEVVSRVIEFRRAVLAGLLSNSTDPGIAVKAAGGMHWERSSTPNSEERSRG